MEKMKCPVCGAEDLGDPSHGMCNRCWWYLAPDGCGVDFGYLMYRIKTYSDGVRRMEIRPRGFWSESIKVSEERENFSDLDSEIKVDISWSCGGVDGTLNPVDTAISFRDAMGFAIDTAIGWRNLRKKEAEQDRLNDKKD